MSRGVSMKRRKIDPETKMVAVLEGLRGESSVADICRKYQISESLYYRWRDKFLAGGSQALSRSLFSLMIPKDQEAEFYSFYEISERGTSWMGTAIFGAVNQAFSSFRLGLLSVIFFFIIGLILLPFVNVKKAMAEAGLS